MDAALETVLKEYEDRSRREWAGELEGAARIGIETRDRMLLSVGPAAGQFMSAVVEGGGLKRILEIGTSYGYSTLWLADAARATGGKVTSLDLADYKQAHAAAALERVGLRDVVDFHAGNALEIIPTLEGPFDFVLLDLWKDLYVPCLELFLPMLAPGAVIVADNMLRPAGDRPEALRYRRAVRSMPDLKTVLLPIGQGLEVSRLAGPDDALL